MSARILKGEPIDSKGTSLLEDLDEAFSTNFSDVFIEEEIRNNVITYGEMRDISWSFAKSLKDLGLCAGDIVTVCADSNVYETYSVILGVWISGLTLSAINTIFTCDEIERLLLITRSKIVYCDEHYIDKISSVVQRLNWEISIISPNGKQSVINFNDMANRYKNLRDFRVNIKDLEEHVLSIIFTSGTSGEPKGVLRYSEGQKCSVNSFTWPKRKKILITSQVFWGTNTLFFLKTILNHGSLVLGKSNTPKDIMQTILTYKPETMFNAASTLMNLCFINKRQKFDLSFMEMVNVGGSHILVDNKREVVQTMFEGRNILTVVYGSTEAGVVTFSADEVEVNSTQYASIGKLRKGVEAKIVDVTTGEIVGPYQHGELCVKSKNVLKRYLQRALTTDELDSEGWWHMGDIVYYDEDEFIYYVSRLKELIKCRGYHIAPGELEAIIQQHPDIIESCVVGKPNLIECNEQPAAFVVKCSSSSLTEGQLYDFVSEKVVESKNLRGGIYFVGSLPKSSVGKPLRKELLKLLN